MSISRMMFLSLLSLWLVFGCTQKPSFYVSTKGDDLNDGSKEKPFATIQRASEAVRKILKQKPRADIKVFLDGGIYLLQKPLILGPEDSGRDDFQVIYTAERGENPIISGGSQITGWTKNDMDLWVAEVPMIDGKSWIFRELFIDDKRARRARHPNSNYLQVAGIGADNRTNFFYNPDDFPLPEKIRDVELVLLHDWSITRIRIKEINNKRNQITAIDSIGAKCLDFFTIGNWEPNPRYFLENSITFIDEHFEWFLDNETHRIYLNLPSDTHPGDYEITAPYAENLLILKGTENDPIRNVTFNGISFKHCAYSIPEMGYAGIQACFYDPREGGQTWDVIPSAIEATWSENCNFNNCTLEHLGGSGLLLGEGSRNCTVSGTVFSDISGNGIMIGEGNSRMIGQFPWWKSAPRQVAVSNRVENCILSGMGQQFFGAVGIWSGITANTIIKDNLISDLPYTGISVGWHWSTEPTPCREVRIEGNRIHHIMKSLSDGGGIYVLGLQPGGQIIHNHIHDVDINAGRAESNGMFLDEGTTDMTIAYNLIYNIAKSPLRFHRAAINQVYDNVLVCGEDIPPIRFNRTIETDIIMENNLILSESSEEDMKKLDDIIAKWNYK